MNWYIERPIWSEHSLRIKHVGCLDLHNRTYTYVFLDKKRNNVINITGEINCYHCKTDFPEFLVTQLKLLLM